jgi:hypothetical protein
MARRRTRGKLPRTHRCQDVGAHESIDVADFQRPLAVNFLEVVHSAQAVNADVAKLQ